MYAMDYRSPKKSDNAVPVVLVIDDSPEIRELLVVILKELCRVVSAASVEDALALVRKHRPAVVITDYDLPGRNGLEGAREMRGLFPDLGIVMLTGSATEEVIEQALRECVDLCVPKPFDLQTVRDSVRLCLCQA